MAVSVEKTNRAGERATVWTLCLGSLVLTLVVWWVFSVKTVWGDTGNYVDIARNLYLHGNYSIDARGALPTAYRLPGYPVFLVPFMAAWPAMMPVVSFVQATMVAATVVLVYLTARRLGLDKSAALMGAGLTATHLDLLIYSRGILSDIPAAFCFTLGVALLVLAPRRIGWLLVAGLAIAVSVLHRPGHVLLAPLVLVVLAVTVEPGRPSLTRLLRQAVWVALPTVLLLGSWIVRNDLALGRPTIATFRGKGDLFIVHYLRVTLDGAPDDFVAFDRETWRRYEREHPAEAAVQPVAVDREGQLFVETEPFSRYEAALLHDELARRGSTIWRVVARNAVDGLFIRVNDVPRPHDLKSLIFAGWGIGHGLVVWLGLLGLMLGRRIGGTLDDVTRRRLLWLMAGCGLFIVATFAVQFPIYTARFNLPIVPLVDLAAGAGLAGWLAAVRRRSSQTIA